MGIMALSGAVLRKCGQKVNPVMSGSNIFTDEYIAQAEAVVNSMARFNFSDVYPTLNSDVKLILEDAVSNLAATYCIIFDMSGYTSRVEAEDMISVLRDGFLRDLSILRDKKVEDFINAAGS